MRGRKEEWRNLKQKPERASAVGNSSIAAPPAPLAGKPAGGLIMPADVFRNDHFVARAAMGFASDACVVTFDSYSDTRSLDRPGFGEHFFAHEGIDAVHVIAR